jgi:hypothetical protein
MVLIVELSVKDALEDLKDLMEVCGDCQATANLGEDLYATHLYLAHLRDRIV